MKGNKKSIIVLVCLLIIIIGFVGFKMYQANSNADEMVELSKEAAASTKEETGMNMEDLEALQQKLDKIKE